VPGLLSADSQTRIGAGQGEREPPCTAGRECTRNCAASACRAVGGGDTVALAIERSPDTIGREEQVLDLHRRGLRLVPRRGKVPLVKEWQFLHLGESDVRAWARHGVNFGAITGDPLVVLDTDSEAAEAWVKHQGIESPVMVRTGGGGLHRYFQRTDLVAEIHSRNGMHKIHGLDLKAWHSFIVLPGSVHPVTGRLYEFLAGKELGALHELPPFDPAWARELPREPVWTPRPRGIAVSAVSGQVRDGMAYIMAIPSIQGKSGSNACFRVACLLYDAGKSFDEILTAMEEWNESCAFPRWSRKELIHKIESVFKRKGGAVPLGDGR
jgi:hypothetical protein